MRNFRKLLYNIIGWVAAYRFPWFKKINFGITEKRSSKDHSRTSFYNIDDTTHLS